MVDKIALAKSGLKFAAGRKSKNSKKDEKPKTPKVCTFPMSSVNLADSIQPGDNPFYYMEVVHDRSGHPKLDTRGRPVTKERRKDQEYYVHKLGIPEEDAKILLKMKNRAMLMDGGRKVMGTRIPLGFSTVLTFCVPEIGDGIDGLISYVMVVRAGKISGGLGARNHAAMTLNVGRDFAIGAIPFAGAIIDMFYRANTRNSNMLEKILIERAKKAHLHPDASYESSLHESSSDGHSIRSGHATPPQTTYKGNNRHHHDASEPPVTTRLNTHSSKKDGRGTRSNRRFDDFVALDPVATRRTNTSGSKKASNVSHDQSRDAQYTQSQPQLSNNDQIGHSNVPRGGRFVSAKDL